QLLPRVDDKEGGQFHARDPAWLSQAASAMAAHMVILLALFAVTASPAGEPTKTTVSAGPALTSFPAVDTSHLDAAGKAFFEKVANDEVCPCDCPKSFGQCLQEGTKCKPAALLAKWIVQNLENGATAQDMQESITR